MRVMLINPVMTSCKRRKFSLNEPLGLAYIASYLLENGHEVKILDAFSMGANNVERDEKYFRYGLSDKSIKRHIKDYKPEIVGITSMFTLHAKGVHFTAKAVKEANPNIPVVVGGSHVSILPEWVLSDKNIDLIVKGEGEETFLDIVNRVEKGRSISRVQGTIERKNNGIKINKSRPLIKDIDSIPFPARYLLPMNIYLNDKRKSKMCMRPPRANMITSRGCLFNCIFCIIHGVWGRSWRGRNPVKLVDEIEMLNKEYGVREVAFQDDNVSLDRDRMEKLCDEIIERKLDIKWSTPNGIAIWTLDKSLIKKMKKSGCYKLTFGIETGCQKTQEYIRKTQINLDKAKEIIKHCNRVGIWTHSAFIIGFPHETPEQIKQTIKYAISTDLDMVTFWIAFPWPGTDMHDDFRNSGLIPIMTKEDMMDWMANFKTEEPLWDTDHLTPKQIHKIRSEAHKSFYNDRKKKFLNPLRIIRRIHSLEDLKYFIHLLKISREMIGELTK